MSLPADEIGQAARALGQWMKSQDFDLRDTVLLCQTMAAYTMAHIATNKADFEINLTRLKRDVEHVARQTWQQKGGR